MKTMPCLRLLPCVLGAVLAAGGVNAAVNSWTTAVSGSWGTGGNWSGGVPQSTDDIEITAAGEYTVSVDNATADNDLGLTVTSLTVRASSGLPELAVGFTNAVRTLMVGAGNDGSIGVGTAAGTLGLLSLATGKVSAARLHLGSGSGGDGRAHISGGTAQLRSMSTGAGNEWLRLGPDAGSSGTLVMTGGQISGPASLGGTYGHVGGAGNGSLIISNGLFVTGGYGLHVGASAGYGELKLYGGTLRHGNDLGTKYMEVGSGGNSEGFILIDGGTLVVTNNAKLTFGVRGGSRGIATISNGVLDTVDGDLYLGSRADSYGELNVAGGTNRVYRSWIGVVGLGVVNVMSEGYMTSVGGWTMLATSSNGRGTLNVSGNGVCEIGGYGILMGDGDGAWSEINVTGGNLTIDGPSHIRSGRITVSNGTFSAGTSFIGTTGGTGTSKTGTVAVAGGTVTLGSTTVGNGRPGFFRIAGNAASVTLNALTATTTDSTLQFTLTETGVTPVTVNNALTLSADTRLEIDLGDYRYMTHGLEVPLFVYGSRSGAFDDANITFFNTGSTLLSVDPGNGANDAVTLRIEPPPRGTFIMVR